MGCLTLSPPDFGMWWHAICPQIFIPTSLMFSSNLFPLIPYQKATWERKPNYGLHS